MSVDIEETVERLYRDLQSNESITEPIAKQIEAEKKRIIEEYRSLTRTEDGRNIQQK